MMELMNPEHPEIVSHLPPVLMTSSRGDFLRRYTLRFARALHEQDHPCQLLYYPESRHLGHAFPSMEPSLPESREVLTRINRWLNSLSSETGS
jgi:acetyl esterase/lipase